MTDKLEAISKVENGKYLAQCRVCGHWREVQPTIRQDATMRFWEVDFLCCDTQQRALFFTI